MSGKSTTGLSENIGGLLCYLCVWVTGLIFLVVERENKFIRFCALQSLIWFGALSVVSLALGFALGWIPLIGVFVHWILGVIGVVSWLFLMYTGYRGKTFQIPYIGEAVKSQIYK